VQPSQKFYYLKQYLSDRALNAISSFCLMNTEKAYMKAKDMEILIYLIERLKQS